MTQTTRLRVSDLPVRTSWCIVPGEPACRPVWVKQARWTSYATGSFAFSLADKQMDFRVVGYVRLLQLPSLTSTPS